MPGLMPTHTPERIITTVPKREKEDVAPGYRRVALAASMKLA